MGVDTYRRMRDTLRGDPESSSAEDQEEEDQPSAPSNLPNEQWLTQDQVRQRSRSRSSTPPKKSKI